VLSEVRVQQVEDRWHGKYRNFHISQIYGLKRPVTVIALTLLYVDDVRTSLETQDSIAGYGDSFTFYMQMMFVPHRKHRTLLPVIGIALPFYM
jgi:hypothetical protein